MASMKDVPTIPLKLFVDKERKRVVVAEACADFVDTLFSFLTLPLGTLTRIVSNNQTHEAVEIGCINNLYTSVQNLDTQVFWYAICKKMLLHPRNSCEAHCENLKLKVDDAGPTKYFMCGSCHSGKTLWLSTFAGLECGECGKSIDKEMKLVDEEDSEEEAKKDDGVFVKSSTMYLIFDDLKVLKNSPGNSIKQLVQLGYTDFNNLTQISASVGLKEILELLKRALVSNSALSDVLLGVKDSGGSNPLCSFTLHEVNTSKLSMYPTCLFKVTVSKSKKKILYAEAEGEYVNFLLNFLTIPFGSILKILDGKISAGCMQNLYASVKGLSSSWFTEYSQGTTPLLDLKVASLYGCGRQPLLGLVSEQTSGNYWYGNGNGNGNGVISKKLIMGRTPYGMKLFDPRSAHGTTEKAEGFVKRPSLFVVMDDLQLMPMTCASSFSFLQKLNVPLDDLEQHDIKIGNEEAVKLLGASLTSKAALTNGLFYLVKMAKEEVI